MDGKGRTLLFFNDAREEFMIVLETEHLLFRPLTLDDQHDLTALYADPEVMRYLGGPRKPDEVQRVLREYIQEYQIYGHSFFATIHKEDQRFIGHCGLLHQEVENRQEIELAYVLAHPYWKQGLALEGARALKDYGFQQLGLPSLISLIPPENHGALRIADAIGMSYSHDVDQWGQNFRLYQIIQPWQAESK